MIKAVKKKISVIIPVYNELENLGSLIRRLHTSLEITKLPYEIIFIDDYSNDGTYEYLLKINKNENLVVVRKEGKKGKAFSIAQGIQIARGELIGMIDGDLQYPPEAIPEMIKLLVSSDIVVANRKKYHGSPIRKMVSESFKFVFGKMLFGFTNDVQSGLKVFKKEVWDLINYTPKSAWSFDLEFLYKAVQLGYKISEFDIDFVKRQRGNSKVNIIKTSIEIGFNTILVRTKNILPHHISPENKNSMIGAGVRYKKKKYTTHTTLPYHKSAIITFDYKQKCIFLLLITALLIGGYLQPITLLKAIIAALSVIYFIDVLFNLYLISKSLSFSKEITFYHRQLSDIDDRLLPVYSILCPLYKEAHVIPQFVEAVSRIDWPKDKLDVLLLLEEDDLETCQKIEGMKLPSFIKTIIVPDSMPKTKPKACNYGLSKARGKYLVIYDAEDIPDPMQLKKAYLAFKKVKKDVICLQAKLNYYNPDHNLLTRFFTAEYSLWFDVVLTGLQSLETSIPLGGTSNHFRTSDLVRLQGWDPFNVTEDADLGVRLFRKGYKTEIFDSTTYEEANSKFKNWMRQRSRWIKGYMQTYFVHMRKALEFTRAKKIHMLFFQLTVGGKLAFIFINPFLWLATISYFVFYRYVGQTIESLYPSLIFYMAAISLVFGNFMFMYFYMIGVVKRGQWELVKYVLLIPFYWLMISFAGFIALFQLIFKPFYWEKTIHGFHLIKPVKKQDKEFVIIPKVQKAWFQFPQIFYPKVFSFISKKRSFYTGGILIGAGIVGNFLNFVFNAYLGRKVGLSEFATVNLVAALLSLSSIIFIAFLTSVNYNCGYLIGKNGNDNQAYKYWKYIRGKSFKWGLLIAAVWFGLTPVLLRYFNTHDVVIFILFGIVLLARFAYSADRGFLSAKFMFLSLAVLTVFEPVMKLILTFAILKLDFSKYAYATSPIALFGTFILGWLIIIRQKRSDHSSFVPDYLKHFSLKFFSVSILFGISSLTFLSMDVILANHFLSAVDSGKYALISLVGKMIFFMGGLSSQFVMPLVSRNEGAKKSSNLEFISIFISTTILSTLGFILFGVLGNTTVPILYGNNALSITGYLIPFTFGIMCFTVSRVFASYYLAKKIYSFSVAGFFLAIVQFVLIYRLNSSIGSIVLAMSITGILNLILMVILHLNVNLIQNVEKIFTDLIGLLAGSEHAYKKTNKKSILIFNWRDIKHKWAGGAELYIHELAKRWVKDGNRVTVFCGNDGKNLRQEKINNIQIIRRGGFYTVYIWAFLYYIFKFRGKFDLIIDCENGIPFFTPFYAREKIFLLIHHVHQEVFTKSLNKPLAFIATLLEINIMPLAYKNIQIITVSESSKKKIKDKGLTNLEPIVIYNGVDLEKYRPWVKSENPVVLYLGRLQFYKSLNVFIHAARKVLKVIPNVEFVIAGDGEKRQDLENYVRRLGLQDKIKFTGKVSEKEKISLYQKAWVFVNPSFMEGWGITTIEANACGTPVVASDVPGLQDSIKNPTNGFLVPYGNSNLFAKNICKIISDDDLRAKMSWKSIQWARKFSWEKSAEDFYKVIISTQLQKNASGSKDLTYTNSDKKFIYSLWNEVLQNESNIYPEPEEVVVYLEDKDKEIRKIIK